MSGKVDDLAGLPELTEKTLLEEIQARYNQERIYVRNLSFIIGHAVNLVN